ncbi:HAMP domain-containing sensor histidine kinase [uncultured Algimonas sp.]|uniref:sensor histidine kinase n=1 Tax=uncultured Algimonas sp. TaxID=1547920 RepID=UPI00260DB5F8|nr:HAMP domain-containing sensor histidine kinase [uncultured Algimonas sp.]
MPKPDNRHDTRTSGGFARTLGRLFRNTVFRLTLVGSLLFGVSLLVAQLIVYDRIVTSELRLVDEGLRDDLAEIDRLFVISSQVAIQRAKERGLLPADATLQSPEAQEISGRIAREVVSERLTQRDLAEDRYSMFVLDEVRVGKLITDEILEEGIEADVLEQFKSENPFRYRAVSSNMNLTTGEIEDSRIQVLGLVLWNMDQRIGILMVGRDIEPILRSGERMRAAITTSSLIAVLLGILSSIFVARRFARRVDSLNKLARDVQAGHLDRRAPRTYSEDEMDRLAGHLNGMLDHIDRLMQAMRYAGDSVAHDLRTPLTRLRTRLETAAVEAGEGRESDVLYAAAADADELLGTFDAVLRIARLEAGERRELLQPLDPKPVLDDLAELYEPACEDAGLTFSHDIGSGLTILADRGLLSQAVSNLLENAIKYAGGGGGTHIALIARKGPRGQVEIAVADDGPGIPAFERERVRERFVRLDKSRTLPGSGLGLALVDAVAELHQAELRLDAGLGTTDEQPGLSVQLIFPKAKPAKAGSARETQPADR